MTSAPSTFEDSTLIKLALRGQVECFAALRDRHIVAVRRRISSMLRNTHDVDDLLQEVFLKAWCHLSTFRSESTFRTWIIRVATNEVLQSYRREKRRSLSQDLDLDILPCGGDSPHESVARSETTRTVRRAVATLPSKYRQVLILRDLKELSERETAQPRSWVSRFTQASGKVTLLTVIVYDHREPSRMGVAGLIQSFRRSAQSW
jgi:RNA polymerase sigma-70 factor, ECF subfamily